MSHVFHRTANPIEVARSEGCWVYDTDGNAYLDAAGGAIVSNIGHGVIDIGHLLEKIDYIHPSVFTTPALEDYADRLSRLVPVDGVRIFPTSGGAESVETAIKMARSFQIAVGQPERDVVISRDHSYHGNTLGALDLSGRPPLRKAYETWLGRFAHVPQVNEYRCPSPEHPVDCAGWHARQLEERIVAFGPERVAAFIGESIGGAATAAAVPPEGYWEAVADVCRRHGVLLIVDEVMTGFGRTGKWFAIEHSTVRPDILVSGKGAGGGYWPLGHCMASEQVYDAIMEAGGFVHGFTFSHSPSGAAVGAAVLDKLIEEDLVSASEIQGKTLMAGLQNAIGALDVVGDIRGKGLMIGVEFVSDRESKKPFPREDRYIEGLAGAARKEGLLVYPSSGCVDGTAGDSILLGPPFTISNEEIEMVVDRLRVAIEVVAP
jgi:adenosylmethionine-8-amino-7-oxononanoate aminotransferase